MDCISDPTLQDLTSEELVGLVSSPPPYFVFLADAFTFTQSEHPILAVDLNREPGRTVRVVPTSLWSIENNLSLGNSDFSYFADVADSIPDRIYRGS